MKLFRNLKKTKKTQPQPISRAEALGCVPKLSPAIKWQPLDNGEILIEYPLVLKPILKAVFTRFNKGQQVTPTKKLQLDALGSSVWLLMDGERSVAEIITAFRETSTLTSQEAELSVTSFLRALGKRGLIFMSQPQDLP